MLTEAGRFTCHFCSAALLSFPVFRSDHGDRFIHLSSVLNSYFGSKTRDSRMLHTASFVSLIALASVGLRELSEFASWAKGTDPGRDV